MSYGSAGKGPKCEALCLTVLRRGHRRRPCKLYARQEVDGHRLCAFHAATLLRGDAVPMFADHTP